MMSSQTRKIQRRDTHKVIELTMSFGLGILRRFVQESEVVRWAILRPGIEKLGDGVGSRNPAAQVHLYLLHGGRAPPLDGDWHFFGREQVDQAVR
jgi:hypothetical protein